MLISRVMVEYLPQRLTSVARGGLWKSSHRTGRAPFDTLPTLRLYKRNQDTAFTWFCDHRQKFQVEGKVRFVPSIDPVYQKADGCKSAPLILLLAVGGTFRWVTSLYLTDGSSPRSVPSSQKDLPTTCSPRPCVRRSLPQTTTGTPSPP